MTHHLDTTGSAAHKEILALQEVAVRAEQDLQSIHDRIDAAHPEIEGEWAAFRDRLHAVTARAGQEVTHVRELGAPTAAALEALHKTVEAFPDEMQALHARASEKLERFRQWCAEREGELRERSEEVEATSARLKEKAAQIASSFEEAAGRRQEALHKLTSTLAAFHGSGDGAHQVSATERHATMVEALHESAGNLDRHETELLDTLAKERQSLESELAEVLGTSEEATASTLAGWRTAHEHFFADEVEPHVTTALTALAEHQASASDDSAATEEANEELERGHQELHEQLGAVSSTVEGFLGLLSQFTFIRF